MHLKPTSNPESTPHNLWVRCSHWIVTFSFFALVITGIEMIMVHPRFYWGEIGNDLTPALFELPVSRNYKHGGWEKQISFTALAEGPKSASRTYEIFNQNGWGRSLHFLAGWFLLIPGLVYFVAGFVTGHFRKHLLVLEFSWQNLKQDIINHLRLKVPEAELGPQYGLLQKCSYLMVVFLLMPIIVMTGMTMSPTITASYPFLLKIFFGAQSARTIHLFASITLLLFFVIHVFMVIKSGFKKQIKSMTLGK